ncbi:EipA family protein [Chelativorans sp.]|uniref:DUF1134 domain-containing protein n=1 Tax=Chelativorans sp. TaxID=2203393 RepID=UPI0028118956|nr:EipA family protein [Chelativorans sp.]
MLSSLFKKGIPGSGRAARLAFVALAVLAALVVLPQPSARAQSGAYTMEEIVEAGSNFFGATTGGLATLVEKIFSTYGLPNGYVLGQEGSGAIVGGLTYGEGTLYTKNAGDHGAYWQGPSLGWDFGAQGSRVMILVYNLDQVNALYKRYMGVAGSAYIVAGLGFNVLKNGPVLIVPIRTGVGARLGVNVGYLKMTAQPTWNPF